MTDSQSNENWVNSWLEQQRAALERASGAKAASDSKKGASEPWRAAADSYLDAMKSAAGNAGGNAEAPPFQPFVFGEELLQVWRTTWESLDTTRQAATANLAEVAQRLPSLGIASEQIQLWRDLAAAQAECHVHEQELRKVLLKFHRDALDLLEAKLKQSDGSAANVGTFRELYDLWVECSEEIYARLARTDAFAKLQADLGNATVKLRARQQKLIEHALRQFDLPTRAELNSLHLQVRDLKRTIAQLQSERPAAPSRSKAKVSPTRRRAAGARR